MVTPAKKRRAARLSLGEQVEYVVLDKSEYGQCSTESKDISSLGICIIGFEKLKVGDVLGLAFAIPRPALFKPKRKQFLTARGKVVWINGLRIGNKRTDMAFEMGIEFIHINAEDRDRIQKLVSAKILRFARRR
ncbi:MAG: PilZ domain-containing protein [Deltaproteobacteria bacterium]